MHINDNGANMIKSADFVEQYKKGKIPASTLVKMAAFRNELETTLETKTNEELMKIAAGMPGMSAIRNIFQRGMQGLGDLANWAPGAVEGVKGVKSVAEDFRKGIKYAPHISTVASKEGLPIGQMIAGGAIFGGSMTLFMEAVKAIEGVLVDWKDDLRKPHLFKEMLTLHPALSEYDVNTVKTYYEALWHFSPIMAENPLAAGAYIRQALTMHHVAGGPLPNSINEITSIQKNWSQGTKDDSESTMTTVMTPFKTSIMNAGK
jgi:hypothetical protein